MGGLAFYLPKDHPYAAAHIRDELKVLFTKPVMLAFLTTVLGFGGVFTVFTYIAPILTKITLIGENALSLILVLFGIGLVFGNLVGGKLADESVMRTLIGSLVALAITLFSMSLFLHNEIATVVLVVLLGIFGFATVPSLQMRVLQKAASAPALGSAFNIGAFNLGNALGAWAGGLVIDHGPGLAAVPIAAGLVAILGIGAAVWSSSLDVQS